MFFYSLLLYFAFSHQVGIEAWCISYSPTHRVCMYKSEAICQNVLASIEDFESHTMLGVGEKVPANFKKNCEKKELSLDKSPI